MVTVLKNQKQTDTRVRRTTLGNFSMKSAFEGDVRRDLLREGFERHHTEVLVASGAHCDGASFLLFVAYDQDVGKLLH
jgi:hypothetical protein